MGGMMKAGAATLIRGADVGDVAQHQIHAGDRVLGGGDVAGGLPLFVTSLLVGIVL